MLKFILAAGVAAIATLPATAANLVQNGGFEAGYVNSTEFGGSFPGGAGPTGWTSASANAFNLYLDPATATTVETVTRFGEGGQKLATSFAGASPDGGKFVLLDGDSSYNGALSQAISGLIVGKTYNLDFYWAGTQLQNRSGPTTEQLAVSFGGLTQYTPVAANPSQGFQGWFSQRFQFTATSTSDVLSFLSIGTPNGLPPVALLDGITLSAVPETASWLLMIAGFTMVGAAARRRTTAVAA